MENLGKLVYQKNNSGAIKVARQHGASSFLRFGKRGAADFLVWIPCRVYQSDGDPQTILGTIFLEVKTDKGRMSEGQREFAAMVTKLGGTYVVVHSMDEAVKLIELNLSQEKICQTILSKKVKR
jgi:hypothetical protein